VYLAPIPSEIPSTSNCHIAAQGGFPIEKAALGGYDLSVCIAHMIGFLDVVGKQA
jgi:hypothetical protein